MPAFKVTLVRRTYEYIDVEVHAIDRAAAESEAEEIAEANQSLFNNAEDFGESEIEAINAEEVQ